LRLRQWQSDGSYEGYTDSAGNEFTGERGSFDITDNFVGIMAACIARCAELLH
jgi:hypothetical protein